MAEDSAPALSGPSSISLSLVTRPRLRAAPGARLAVGPIRVAVTNATSEPATVSRVFCDPVQHKETGETIDGVLAIAWPSDGAPGGETLAPGASASLTLSGQIAERAGSYVSTLRVQSDHGAPLALPVTIDVAASPVWGIACMVLGLVSVGLLSPSYSQRSWI